MWVIMGVFLRGVLGVFFIMNIFLFFKNTHCSTEIEKKLLISIHWYQISCCCCNECIAFFPFYWINLNFLSLFFILENVWVTWRLSSACRICWRTSFCAKLDSRTPWYYMLMYIIKWPSLPQISLFVFIIFSFGLYVVI